MTSTLAERYSTIQNFKRTLKAPLSDTNLWSTNEVAGGHSVWPIRILWSLQLNLKPLHSNLEPVHGLDGGLCTGRVVKTHKACKVQNKTRDYLLTKDQRERLEVHQLSSRHGLYINQHFHGNKYVPVNTLGGSTK